MMLNIPGESLEYLMVFLREKFVYDMIKKIAIYDAVIHCVSKNSEKFYPYYIFILFIIYFI